MQALKIYSFLLLIAMTRPIHAQQSTSRVTIEITKEVNGEQKSFKGEYPSEVAMKADPAYREFVGETGIRKSIHCAPKTDSSIHHLSFSFDDLSVNLEKMSERFAGWDSLRMEDLSMKLEKLVRDIRLDSLVVSVDHFPQNKHLFTGPPPHLHSVPDGADHFVRIEIKETTGKDFGRKGKIDEDDLLNLREFRYFPNPSHGSFRLSFTADPGPLTIHIYNIKDQEIYTRFLPAFRGQFSELIDLTGQEPGSYLLEIRIDKKRLIRKVIVE